MHSYIYTTATLCSAQNVIGKAQAGNYPGVQAAPVFPVLPRTGVE